MRKMLASGLSGFALGLLVAGGSAVRAQVRPQHAPAAVALRVEGERHGRIVGTLVADVGGEWVEVDLTPRAALVAP